MRSMRSRSGSRVPSAACARDLRYVRWKTWDRLNWLGPRYRRRQTPLANRSFMSRFRRAAPVVLVTLPHRRCRSRHRTRWWKIRRYLPSPTLSCHVVELAGLSELDGRSSHSPPAGRYSSTGITCVLIAGGFCRRGCSNVHATTAACGNEAQGRETWRSMVKLSALRTSTRGATWSPTMMQIGSIHAARCRSVWWLPKCKTQRTRPVTGPLSWKTPCKIYIYIYIYIYI